jgi:Tfp pilus assembly protein PilW
MKAINSSVATKGATLVETMVAAAVSVYMFACILTATVTLNRIFAGAMEYSSGTTDQQRAMDYIARDLRRAYTVTVSQSDQTLTVTVPDCYTAYDAQGNPTGSLAAPTISNGVVNYSSPIKPLTICYYINGGQLLRQQTIGATGASNTLVIANSVQHLTSTFADLTSIVTFSITFAPHMTASDSADAQAQAATTLTASTSVRNLRRD